MSNPLTIYKDSRKQWRWRVTAENGKIIGASSESYKRRKDCKENVDLLFDALHDAVVVGEFGP